MARSMQRKRKKKKLSRFSRFLKRLRYRWKRWLFLLCFLAALFCFAFPDTAERYAPGLTRLLWQGNPPDSLRELLWHGNASAALEALPDYSGSPYVILNHNRPDFLPEDFTTNAYETYSVQDVLGRCGSAMACIGRELMPTQERKSISEVTPSGWQVQKYDFVDQEYLYNRCHLIGFQLTGENANERNLITGTRYMNVEGMLPFENLVAEYVRTTGNHVLYRVTPVFEGANLVADGVQIEASSVEDGGRGVCFHVFVYNVQPGVQINYLTGMSRLAQPE